MTRLTANGPTRKSRGALKALLPVAAAVTLAACGKRPLHRAEFEEQLNKDGRVAINIDYTVPDDAAARSIGFDRSVLATAQLYLRGKRDTDDYIHIDADGTVLVNGTVATTLQQHGELLLTDDDTTLFCDGQLVASGLREGRLYWISSRKQPPTTTDRTYPIVQLNDSFMREKVEAEACIIRSGTWRLNQHGGGLTQAGTERARPHIERAVNPFTALGRNKGVLQYGSRNWRNYHFEARFYFGRPHTNNVVDLATVPRDTDMLVGQGPTNGTQIAFGWVGARGDFALLRRKGGSDWHVLDAWREARPPVTDWFRAGLSVSGTGHVRAFLDGVPVLATNIGQRASGPAFVMTGAAPAEIDDIRAWTIGRRLQRAGHPVYVKSRQFADKQRVKGRDPPQFNEWAASSGTFRPFRDMTTGGLQRAGIIADIPLFGDFEYESVTAVDATSRMPTGLYEYVFHDAFDAASEPHERARFRVRFDGERWRDLQFGQARHLEAGGAAPTLRFKRDTAMGGRIMLQQNGRWTTLTPPLNGALKLTIARLGKTSPRPPDHRHHALFCMNLRHEFFEDAPSEWSWTEGAFRMATRWACKDRWNFMACGGTGVPYMASKRRFYGDQMHEYFMSLRAVFPWDAGDTAFSYDPKKDRGNKTFHANHGWYNRHNLNFAFCTDGRNPLSGYAVIFGGANNTRTMLLRRGRVVAETRERRFLFPVSKSHGAVHWRWWKFTVTKHAGRIAVHMNDSPMLTYTDPEPLDGGAVGFWTVRNGFILARATSGADRIEAAPHTFYTSPDDPTPWQPLVKDAIHVTRKGNATRVRQHVGAGFFAVRHQPAAPVDLQRNPILHLPIELGANVAVNLHLFVGGRSYVLQISAPVTDMKALLTPEYERGECFQLPVIPAARVASHHLLGKASPGSGAVNVHLADAITDLKAPPRDMQLTHLTVGNSSNTRYLLAGAGGTNAAGCVYMLGQPAFLPETSDAETP